MPLPGGIIAEAVPEERKIVPAIVSAAVGPAIGQLGGLHAQEVPHVPRDPVRTKAPGDAGAGDTCLLHELPDRRLFGRLARLDGALDELQPGLRMAKRQDFDTAAQAEHNRARFVLHEARYSAAVFRPLPKRCSM